MDKHPRVLYKGLVVGVIVLFIGMGIQPVFANNILTQKEANNDIEDIFIPDIYVRPLWPEYEYETFYAGVFTRFGIYEGILNVTATVTRLPSMTIEKTKNWSEHIKLVPYTGDYPKIYKFKVGKLAPGFFLINFEIFPEEQERFEFNNKCHKIYFINIFGINIRILFVIIFDVIRWFFHHPLVP